MPVSSPAPQVLLSLANTWSQKQTLSAGASIASGQSLDWNSDLFIFRDAANILAQRNGTSAQVHRVYNTFTDASNYERATIGWNANILSVLAESAGTGTARQLNVGTAGAATLNFVTNNNIRWQLSAGGTLQALADNTYDIGASGANRPRNLFMGGYVRMAVTVVSSLPSAATAGAGARMVVSDASAPTFGSTVAGSGAVTTPVYSDGTNWKVG